MPERKERTVLLIDRSPADREACRAILAAAGFRMLNANSGPVGLALVRHHQPDLIVVAIRNPDSDEHRAITALRERTHTRHTPVLVIGAAGSEQDLADALDAGADEYLLRPINRKELLVRVQLAMDSHRNQSHPLHDCEDLTRRLDAMSTLHNFYEEVLTDDAVETACQRSAETAASLVDSRRVSVLLADAQHSCLRFAHAVGIEDFSWRDQRVPLSSPVAGRVMATRHELVVNNAGSWPNQAQYHHQQFVSMPLVSMSGPSAGKVLGVLNVTERRDRSDYQPQDVLALRQLARAAAFAIDATRTRKRLDATRDAIIFSLARLSEYRHASTGKHLERVRELSLLLARYLASDACIPEQIDAQFLADLGQAAPLHDVGKVGIPDRILLKHGPLSSEEFTLMQDHTRIGAATLQAAMAAGEDASFVAMAMDIAHCHHERYDGKGYPRGLAADNIPLSARIVCVADSYDAIRTAREYKPARTHAEAVREITAGSGKQYDPIMVHAFCALEDQFERIYNNLTEEDANNPDGPSNGELFRNLSLLRQPCGAN